MVEPNQDWQEWIEHYSRGEFPSTRPPIRPHALEDMSSYDTPTTTSRPSRCSVVSLTDTVTSSSSSLGDRSPDSPGVSATPLVPPIPIDSREAARGQNEEPPFRELVESPRELREFYKRHEYLPAPNGPHEAERLRTIKRYGLDRPERKAAIDRICRIAKAYFQTKTVIITLVLEDQQVLVSETGWIPGEADPLPDAPPRSTPLEASFCRHAITRVKATEPFVVPNAAEDFRFKKNPYNTTQGGTLAFYASANISVPTRSPHATNDAQPQGSDSADALQDACPDQLPVGSLCLIDNEPKNQDDFTEDDKGLLQDLAFMAAQEFQLGFETARRDLEQKRSKFLGTFLDSTLVTPSSPSALSKNKDPLAACNLHEQQQQRHSAPSTRAIHDPTSPMHEFHRAARELRALTKSSAAAFFDLRSFRAPLRTDSSLPSLAGINNAFTKGGRVKSSDMGSGRSVSSMSPPKSPKPGTDPDREGVSDTLSTGMGRVYLLGGDGSVDWDKAAQDPELSRAIVDALNRYYLTNQTEFDSTTGDSALQNVLPESATASCIVPIFDIDGSPALILVLVSTEAHFQFGPTDRAFVQNVGTVAMSAMLRQRAIEADRAKLAFVSQISHELRTPLHGINSQFELIREFATPQQLLKLAPLLDTADVCLESLRQILDDTLDFSKLSNNSPEEIADAQKRSLARNNLETLAEDVSKAVWVRKKRVDLVSADAAGSNGKSIDETGAKVDVVLEVQERKGGWGVWVDAGGMKRVLLNILGNALKFTKSGHVKLTVGEISNTSLELGFNQRLVELVVEDTGRGMSEEFLREGKLFTPFVQENPFANGAGLGMSICDTIIRRMGGRLDVASALGQGTTVRILVPLEFCHLEDDSPPGTPNLPTSISSASLPSIIRQRELSSKYRKRIISDELTSLFSPGAPLASPYHEKSQFDFSQAVSQAQASLGQPNVKRTPSVSSSERSRKMSFLGERATDLDFVDEMAKLSVGSASSPQTVQHMAPNEDFFSLQTPPASTAFKPPGFPQQQQDLHDLAVKPEGFIPSSPTKRYAERVRVLLADDNVIGRSILTKLFSGKGIEFAQAENGQEAVDLYAAENGRFNLILVDVQMPILDGIQAAHEIRKFEKSHDLPRCRIIALTGFAEDHHSSASVNGTTYEDEDENPRTAVDSWLVKGGKSLAVILREVRKIEEDLIETELEGQAQL
ncbi:hybrid sensor histidine kinase/response regulator [Sporobolomyces koalae]|uniref:hybrid sensor histidine kinase/response regulator n=1 Tax=Sporobolomyces koalae TaxID=500713 RepID=UPI003178D2A0